MDNTKERRKTNKQVTVETLGTELHHAINERKKLEIVVRDVQKKVNFDGGLVYKCDLEESNRINAEEHAKIMDKLNEIYPRVKEDIKVADAYRTIGDSWGNNVKSSGFWIKFVIGIGVIVGLAMLAVEEVKKFIK